MTHRLRSLAALTAAFPLLALAAPAQVQVRWFQTFDGPDHANDVAAAVAVDASGAVYVAVNDTNGSTFEPRLFKYDASGALAWSRLLVAGPGSVSAVALDPDNGDAIVVGSAPTMPILQQDAFVARYAPDGTRRWFRRWDGPDSRIDSATAVVLGGGGTAYVVANTQRADFLEDFAILAYTAAGALAWEAVLPDTHTEAGSAGPIAIDASGNLLVTGYGGATYPGNAVLVKVTPAGTLAWLREYDGPGAAFDRGYDVASDAQGNVYLAGLVSMNGGPLTPDYGGFLAKYDPQGNLLWDRVVDDPANGIDSLEAVEVDYRGNVVVAGRLGDATRSARAWLAQYDPQGNLVWDRPWSVDDEHFEIWSALALDAGGGITVAGTAYKPLDYPAYDSDVEVQRYDKHGNLRWAHAGLFSVPNGDYPTDLALGPGGEVAYAGVTNAFPGGQADVLVALLRDQSVPFCFGDGSATACPCGNSSAPGDQVGCLNSHGTGSEVVDAGVASLSSDTLSLNASSVPGSIAVFVQANVLASGGQGHVYGDGVSCLGGIPLRLGVETVTNGTATYPGPGDAPISVRGFVVDPSVRYYQVWYRDPASFCTGDTFNLTNGLATTWAP